MPLLPYVLLLLSPVQHTPQERTNADSPLGRHFDQLRIQLELSEAQRTPFDRLVERFHERYREEAKALLAQADELRALTQALREAEAAQDQQRVKELRQRFRSLKPDAKPLAEFYAALDTILTEPQRKRLARLRQTAGNTLPAPPEAADDASAARGTYSGGDATAVAEKAPPLRPRPAVRLAEQVGLSEPQRDALRRLQDELRARLDMVRRPNVREQAARFFVDLRAVLTEAQRAQFDRLVAAARDAEPTAEADTGG